MRPDRKPGYQHDYTRNPVARRELYDRAGRERKAAKILAVLGDFLGDLGGARVLDLSCSTGVMAAALARHARRVVGIDIDRPAVAFARATETAGNLDLLVMDALDTGFPDGVFDIAVCNQMYEHVPDPARLMAEIRRVLRPGGICYFGATNRLKVIETHYGRLPFLSYLPKPAAHLYLRLTGRGRRYYETLYTYWGLCRLVRGFERIDYTTAILRDPERFHGGELVAPGGGRQRVALAVARWMRWALPGYVWLLRKPAGGPPPAPVTAR